MIEDLNKHLTDQEFFTYVKFFDMILNKKNIVDEDYDSISPHRLSICKDTSYGRFSRIFGIIKHTDILVKVSHRVDDSINNRIEGYVNEQKTVKSKNRPSKEELVRIHEKIKNNKPIKYSEVGMMSWAWIDVYDRASFIPNEYNISEKVKSSVKENLNKYLKNLIDGELSIIKNNYYKFDVLKNFFIQTIENNKAIEFFGKNFVIKEELNESGNFKDDPNFCIIQTIYALEYLGYLTVNNIWQETEYKSKYDSSENLKYYICININIDDSFISEINRRYKKENPENILDGFIKSKGILKFAGEEIGLSLKGKDTDASLLMNTLYKKNTLDWIHNDQIFKDWKFNDADIEKSPKNKIYFAAKNINEKVAMKTKIKDFIEFNTEKARINPRYNRIDE
jgi:rRNA processing protein Gar1